MTLIVFDAAEQDVAEIRAFLQARRPGLGERFLNEFERSLNRIRQFPERYALYSRRVRLCPLRVFRAGIYYSVTNDKILVLRVIDLRRGRRTVARALRPW